MAPFRNRDRSNRSGRSQTEHNVLEGLPINQYRETEITVGANALDNKPVDKDAWPELPMPRESQMLPEHSQQLLRAARSGRIHKPPAPPEEDNEMKDEEEEVKEVQSGFTVKKYVKIPRHLELSEPEYLAKRRKGLPSQYIPNGVVQPALRETKVKKMDAEGHATVYKVLVPEGQAVEGEVQPTDAAIEIAPAAAAPGTIVEGVGVVNAEGVVVANDVMQQTPPRRRPPPPKRKRGGPGRGKRRVGFVEGSTDQATSAPGSGSEVPAISSIKNEGGSMEPSDGDTPMGEAGADDEEGSGEEGSEDEDHDMEHNSDSATPATPATPAKSLPAPTSVPAMDSAESTTMEVAASAVPPSPVREDLSEAIAQQPNIPETEMVSGIAPDAPDVIMADEAVTEVAPQAVPEAPEVVLEAPEAVPVEIAPEAIPVETAQQDVGPEDINPSDAVPEQVVQPSVEQGTAVAPVVPPETIVQSAEQDSGPTEIPLPSVPQDRPASLNQISSPVFITEVEANAEARPEPELVSESVSEHVPTPAPTSGPPSIPTSGPPSVPASVPASIPTSIPESVPEPVFFGAAQTIPAPILEPEATIVPKAEVVQPQSDVKAPADIPPASPSEPDLMGSLERHLENNSEDVAGSNPP